ncbi:MAG TPA: hypothetical protein VLJ21_01265 [Candidatus Binatia bacterium]|nr:hypothetical protein [Candidatus Binatia bacterium]
MMRGKARRKGMAMTGFIFGILGMVAFWIPVIGTLLTLIAVVCSKAALSWIRHDAHKYGGHAFAVIGFTLGIIFLILSVLVLLGITVIFFGGYLAGKALG